MVRGVLQLALNSLGVNPRSNNNVKQIVLCDVQPQTWKRLFTRLALLPFFCVNRLPSGHCNTPIYSFYPHASVASGGLRAAVS
ncbi:hypothetical protein B9Z55_004726 [Caenorhabditis nigoni]|nr:hypothetical protein B9Z55_004726 [Caenorhabditis nigoni]